MGYLGGLNYRPTVWNILVRLLSWRIVLLHQIELPRRGGLLHFRFYYFLVRNTNKVLRISASSVSQGLLFRDERVQGSFVWMYSRLSGSKPVTPGVRITCYSLHVPVRELLISARQLSWPVQLDFSLFEKNLGVVRPICRL